MFLYFVRRKQSRPTSMTDTSPDNYHGQTGRMIVSSQWPTRLAKLTVTADPDWHIRYLKSWKTVALSALSVSYFNNNCAITIDDLTQHHLCSSTTLTSKTFFVSPLLNYYCAFSILNWNVRCHQWVISAVNVNISDTGALSSIKRGLSVTALTINLSGECSAPRESAPLCLVMRFINVRKCLPACLLMIIDFVIPYRAFVRAPPAAGRNLNRFFIKANF